MPPPCPGSLPSRSIGEVVRVYHGADIAWWSVRKGVMGEQTNHGWGPLQQPLYKMSEPGLVLGTPQGREPHLPIEPRHMGSDKTRGPHDVTRLPGEGIGEPGLAIVAALDDDFWAGGSHDGKQAIGVDRAKGSD